MKNEIILTAKTMKSGNAGKKTTNAVTALTRMTAQLTRYYSQVLGIKLTNRQTLLLLNAQTAFFLTVFPVGCPVLLRYACAGWLISALLKCRNSGIKAQEL